VAGSRRGAGGELVGDLLDRARNGDRHAVARLITLVENDSPLLREIATGLMAFAGRAHVVGLTGSPGVGKSTSTSALVSVLRSRGRRVGVLAIDPTSPFSGGALLGDRIRMQEHATDDGVFVRSMATRGHLGGLAAAVPQGVRILDAAGCDVVLVETVGVGQSEVDVVRQADTTVVLLAPGLGDGIQAAKAGILEIADVFVVNKADRDGADQVTRDLRHLRGLGGGDATGWQVPILKTIATRREGFTEVAESIDQHLRWLRTGGEFERRRRDRSAAEIEALALDTIRRRFSDVRGSAGLAELAAEVADGKSDPFTAADRLLAANPQE
jgi:LAO/AO transport system kinase